MTLRSTVAVPSPSMTPIALREGFGLLHQASGPVRSGVVLCSPWGIDELAARKILFRLATRLAAAGMPALRFDYPGAADAIDRPAAGLAAWTDTATEAADRLKAALGLEKIVFAGIGIGASIALLASARRDDVQALVLAAPVIGGRRYLREIALGAPVVEQGLGLDPNQRPEGVSIGGIVMPAAVAKDLKSMDLLDADPGADKPVLLVERPSQAQTAEFVDHLTSKGFSVDRTLFEGYDAAMDNPTIAVMPEAVIDIMTAWIGEKAGGSGLRVADAMQPAPILLDGPHGTDEALPFGHGLFGVLTHPQARTATPTVVFLNSGYDHHAGWAYQWARAAGTLAAEGIATLRFDMANIGDSPAKPGAAEQVLYGPGQQADIATAIDMLAARGESAVVLVGRCSGAFAAFHAAAADKRIAATVVINPLRMVWDPEEDVGTAIRIGPRSMADYRQRALNGQFRKRLLSGEIDVIGAAKGIGLQLMRRVIRRAAPIFGSLSKTTRLRRQCRAMMEAIGRRGAGIHFVCSERDASLEQMSFYFGSDYRGLKAFPDASLTTVPNADHNITPQAAHDIVVDVIRDTVLRLQGATGEPHGMVGNMHRIRA
jgi:pimeloyl-ACP methyl ester carboxylesterase